MLEIKSSQLSSFSSITIKKSSELVFNSALPPDVAHKHSLTFCSTREMVEKALSNNVAGFIILEKIYGNCENLFNKTHSVWITPSIQWAMSQTLTLFNNTLAPQTAQIHPTAIISPNARIGDNVTIDAFAVVQEGAVIGNHVYLGPHTVIEHHAIIKKNCYLSAQVIIGSYCEVGENCFFSSHTVIGSQGFGFYTDKNFQHHKIPQIGKVIIEDNCEFGSHCAIDRATLTETRIKKGSKLDNLCHIAHNCEIGENAILAGAFKTAGSTKVGKNLMTSGNIDLNGHIHIADNVVLTARTAVVSSIDKPGIYGGFPHLDHKLNLKVMASLSHLPEVRLQIRKILKHLGLDKKTET